MGERDAPHPATVFVVDEDESVRETVQALLEAVALPVECFAGPREFRSRFSPDRRGCLLFDVRMPSRAGIELYEELLREGLRRPAIFVTAHADVPTAVAAMKTGAIEFLEKPFDHKRLIDLVHRAFALDATWRRHDERFAEIDERLAALSAGERETLALVVSGEPNKAIAARLGITERAVEMRRSRLAKKLRVESVAELLDVAVTHRVMAELRDDANAHGPRP